MDFCFEASGYKMKGKYVFRDGLNLASPCLTESVFNMFYSISSKSMRSKSRKGWTCCRTSSSTSTHSASKANRYDMSLSHFKGGTTLWLHFGGGVFVLRCIHALAAQFLSGRPESCGQPETLHRKTGHGSAHGEKNQLLRYGPPFTWR